MSTIDTKVITTVAQVDVQSAWLSKINWTQVIGIGASALVLLTGGKINIPVETQLSLVAFIQAGQGVASWVIRTWFTKTITPASATADDVPTKEVLK